MSFNATYVADHIIRWLDAYSGNSGVEAYVVGVSGGIDSAVTAILCAQTGRPTFIVNMPIHQAKSQFNLSDLHIKWLEEKWNNVEGHLINLSPIYDLFNTELDKIGTSEIAIANTRARLRMATLYALAGSNNGIVVGTGNKVEDFGVGFYTKYGDGGVYITHC